MVLKAKKTDYRKAARVAAEASHDKKARQVEIFDIRKDSDVADYVVIAEVESSTQMRALAGAVEDELQAAGLRPLRRDGRHHQRWIALDYGGLLVHIMLPEARAFYRLEQMWERAKEIDL